MSYDAKQEARRTVFRLDGIRYSLDMAAVIMERLPRTLAELTKGLNSVGITGLVDEREKLAVSALLDVWCLIDACHRVCKLSQETPGLNKLALVQTFHRWVEIERVELLRDHVQHMYGDIPRMGDGCSPVWGGLCWVDPQHPEAQWTMFSGSAVNVTVKGISWDRQESKFTQHIRLEFGEESIDVAELGDRLLKLHAVMKDWLESNSEVVGANRGPMFFTKWAVRNAGSGEPELSITDFPRR